MVKAGVKVAVFGLDNIGKILLALGAFMMVMGLLLMGMGRLGLGRLPGDIIIRRRILYFIFLW